MIHISQASIDILDTLVLFNMFAERTATFLNVRKFILILKEEFAAFITNSDRYIRDHIFVVPARPLWTKLTVVDNENFFKAHALKNSFIDLNSTILIW